MLDDKEKGKLCETNIPFWDVLTKEQRNFLIKNMVLKTCDAGDMIHDCMEQCTGVLFVLSGQLRVYVISEDGREVTLYRLSSGDTCTLSASCILQEITFEVAIDVTQKSEVLIINAAAVLELSKQNVYVENFLYKQTTEHFSDVMWVFQQILFMSFDKRLAIFLLDECAGSGKDSIEMTHETIAKHMGSAREVVSRMLKYMEKEEIVELSRGEIRIRNKKKLRALLN